MCSKWIAHAHRTHYLHMIGCCLIQRWSQSINNLRHYLRRKTCMGDALSCPFIFSWPYWSPIDYKNHLAVWASGGSSVAFSPCSCCSLLCSVTQLFLNSSNFGLFLSILWKSRFLPCKSKTDTMKRKWEGQSKCHWVATTTQDNNYHRLQQG